jgi:hypothetical protein
MKFCYIYPEVAGELGPHTVLDRSTMPPEVVELHHEFHGWLGDAILTVARCYIVTAPVAAAIRAEGLSGIQFAYVEISTDYEYDELYPNRPVPMFVWLQIAGKPGGDDFGMALNNHLVISERALQVLSPFGTEQARIAPFIQDDGVVPETFTTSYILKNYMANIQDC